MKLFDETIRHQQTVFIVAILFAAHHAIKFELYKFTVVLMNALEDQVD